jgi:hypothetical protein
VGHSVGRMVGGSLVVPLIGRSVVWSGCCLLVVLLVCALLGWLVGQSVVRMVGGSLVVPLIGRLVVLLLPCLVGWWVI